MSKLKNNREENPKSIGISEKWFLKKIIVFNLIIAAVPMMAIIGTNKDAPESNIVIGIILAIFIFAFLLVWDLRNYVRTKHK